MIIYSGNHSLPIWVEAELGLEKQIGLLTSYPSKPKANTDCPKFIDNKRYVVWRKGIEWCKKSFIASLDYLNENHIIPTAVVCPDTPTDAELTSKEWKEWYPIIKSYGFNVAFAAQDGHTPKDIPLNADVVFIGGTTGWKRSNIKTFCDAFPRVHVARINSLRWLWVCHYAGAESVDGNGWWRKSPGSSSYGRSCYQDLTDYLKVVNGINKIESNCLFNLGSYTNYNGITGLAK